MYCTNENIVDPNLIQQVPIIVDGNHRGVFMDMIVSQGDDFDNQTGIGTSGETWMTTVELFILHWQGFRPQWYQWEGSIWNWMMHIEWNWNKKVIIFKIVSANICRINVQPGNSKQMNDENVSDCTTLYVGDRIEVGEEPRNANTMVSAALSCTPRNLYHAWLEYQIGICDHNVLRIFIYWAWTCEAPVPS